MKFIMLVKEISTKTLVSGDKQSQVILQTLYPQDVPKIAELSNELEIEVEFKAPKTGKDQE